MHQFINFKGFLNAEINLTKPFIFLIGPNGAGKTNTIEALEILSFIANGFPLNSITDLGRGGALEVRGGLASCPTFQKKHFTFVFSGT